jgi:hypothetical protein
MSLEFGEGHFDRIEIGTVGRQEEKPGAASLSLPGGRPWRAGSAEPVRRIRSMS